jgi:environmental stress-induced protein Ves
LKILTNKDFKIMPWKNGEGTTCELFKIPDPANEFLFLFRLSVATVNKSGSFSLFPGIDRLLMLVHGNGIKLDLPTGDIIINKKFTPFAFSGDVAVYGELVDGPIYDFNIMIARHFKKAEVKILKNTEMFLATSDCFILDFKNIEDYSLWELNSGEQTKFNMSDRTQVVVTLL